MSDVARDRHLPETVDEFLVWTGDGRAKHYELVDGTVRAMSPGSTTHGLDDVVSLDSVGMACAVSEVYADTPLTDAG